LAAWLKIWSAQTKKKSMYISSMMGRIPTMAAPTAMPTNPCSLIGVSMTRLPPNSSIRLRVTRKRPP
jgi:hypothetical protein